jgi:hypothetical protein
VRHTVPDTSGVPSAVRCVGPRCAVPRRPNGPRFPHRALLAALLLLLSAAPRPGLADDPPSRDPGRPDVFPAPLPPAGPPADAPHDPAATAWRVGRTPAVFVADGLATRVGGWIDASYQDSDAARESINVNHLNVFLDTRLASRWQVFLELEFENEPEVRGFEGEREYEVEQAYGRWIASDYFGIRVGQFNTPFGIWTPLHWSILMDTITEPVHEGTRVTPEQQIGVELAGRFPVPEWLERDTELSYSVYSGYGDATEVFEGQGTSGVSLGTDLQLRFRESHRVGLSYYQQTREQDPDHDRSERSVMVYGEWQPLERWTLRSEILRQFRDRHVAPGLSRRINIGYAALRWDATPRIYLAYRYGYGDDEGEGASDDRQAHTVTLGFRPRSSLRIKLEYARNTFRGGDRGSFHYWGVSLGMLF